MAFGNKLKLLRVLHHLTQEEMSRRLLLSAPVYNRHETGTKSIKETDEIVDRVMKEFNVSREWLMDENSEMLYITSLAPAADSNRRETYNLPGEMIDFFVRQQAIMEKLLAMIK